MTMTKETENTTEKSIEKNPYTIRKLVKKWLIALLLMLFILPLLGDILNSFFPVYWSPDMKDMGWSFILSASYFIYMVVWTVRFFLKKKQFGR